MTTATPARVDITRYPGKETLLRLIRHEYRTAFDMLVEASEQQWHAQTPCDMWEVRDLAGHLLDAAYAYLGYFKQGEYGWPTEEPAGMRAYGEALGHSALEYRDTYRWQVLGRLDAVTDQLFAYFDALDEDQWTNHLVPHHYVGPVPAFMMATFQLMDYSVHNWDLRVALGKPAYVDEESSNVLVPFMFSLFQLCFAPERAENVDLTFEMIITTPVRESWTLRISDGECTYQYGAPESADATFEFKCNEFCLDAYQRLQGGDATGDEAAIATLRSLFFTV